MSVASRWLANYSLKQKGCAKMETLMTVQKKTMMKKLRVEIHKTSYVFLQICKFFFFYVLFKMIIYIYLGFLMIFIVKDALIICGFDYSRVRKRWKTGNNEGNILNLSLG